MKKSNTHTKLKKELAARCKISRPTLDRYLEDETFPKPDGERGWNIGACVAWIVAHTEKSAIAAGLDSDIADLKKWDIYERARKQKLANDRHERTLIPRAEHESEIREMSSEVQKQMYAIPPRAPELAGLPVAEIEAKLTEMIDNAVKSLADGAVAIAPEVCPLCQQRKVEVAP